MGEKESPQEKLNEDYDKLESGNLSIQTLSKKAVSRQLQILRDNLKASHFNLKHFCVVKSCP
jgi:hypothetical protein